MTTERIIFFIGIPNLHLYEEISMPYFLGVWLYSFKIFCESIYHEQFNNITNINSFSLIHPINYLVSNKEKERGI